MAGLEIENAVCYQLAISANNASHFQADYLLYAKAIIYVDCMRNVRFLQMAPTWFSPNCIIAIRSNRHGNIRTEFVFKYFFPCQMKKLEEVRVVEQMAGTCYTHSLPSGDLKQGFSFCFTEHTCVRYTP